MRRRRKGMRTIVRTGAPILVLVLAALLVWIGGKKDAKRADDTDRPVPVTGPVTPEQEEPVPSDSVTISAVGRVTAGGVRLRAGGSTDSEILTELKADTLVSVLGLDGGWYKVRCGGLEGHVSADYLEVSSDLTECRAYGRALVDDLPVRAAPGGDVLHTLEKGAYVDITGFEGGYYVVTSRSVRGYISADYLTPEMTKALEPNRPTLPDPTAPKRIWIYKYYIKVNVQTNTVTVYEPDANDYFTVPVRAMICSVGEATPQTGVFDPPGQNGVVAEWLGLFDGVYGQYATHITGDILFHSVPYLKYGDKSSLEYWEFDKLGTTASQGCVRLQVADAKWLHDNARQGHIQGVEFYSSSDPGPLGKPTAPKISEDEARRGWDPTDPDASNPWRS